MNKKDIIEFFNRLAPSWDADMIKNDAIIAKILTGARVEKGTTVLDVACGTGVLFPYYLERGVKALTGVDISPEMIKIAREKFGGEDKISLICADVENLNGKKFDRIVVYNAFPHFLNPENLIKTLSGMLNRGGTLTVAHGMSKAAIDSHHSGSAQKVSVGLIEAEDLANLFKPYLNPYLVISNNEMYQVSAVKE